MASPLLIFLPIKTLIDDAQYEAAFARVTDDMLQLGIVGTPRDVIRQIETLAGAGVAEINLGGPLGPDPLEADSIDGPRGHSLFSNDLVDKLNPQI